VTKPEDPTRDGHILEGWYQNAAHTGNAWNFASDYPSSDMTLYAKWVSATTFNMMGHGTQIDAQKLEDGEKVTKPADPTADGYTFDGWYKDEECKTPWDFGTDTVSGPTTLYAKWTAIDYTVTYKANPGPGETASGTVPAVETYHYNDEVTVKANPFSIDGKKFTGWTTVEFPGPTDTKYAPDARFHITDNVTLYAQWIAGKYEVRYHVNTGTGTAPAGGTDYDWEAEVTVLDKTADMAKADHIFGGWNTKEDGSGITYAAGSKLAVKGDVDLYALWLPLDLKVTYSKGNADGTAPTDDTKYAAGQHVTVKDKGDLERLGFSFAGWNTKPDGTGITYQPGSTFVIEADTDLYAVWTNLLYIHISAETDPGVFDAGHSEYSATVPYEIDHVDLTVVFTHDKVKYSIGTDDPTKATELTTLTATEIGLEVGVNKLYVYSTDDKGNALKYVYTITRKPSSGGGSSSSGGGSGTTYYPVVYVPGEGGELPGEIATEQVASGGYPKKIPVVIVKGGYTFKGWSLDGKTVVDPKTVRINKLTTFKAVYDFNAAASPEHVWYMQGYEDGTFRPNGPLYRSEIAAMLARLDPTYRQGAKTPTFPDVEPGTWYYSYIGHAQAVGLVRGYLDGTFRPTAKITRAEFVTIMCNYLGLKNTGKATFSDTSGHWAEGYIAQLTSIGAINGYPDGTFRPNGEISRAEAAKIVNRVFDRLPTPKLVEDHDLPYSDVPDLYWAREDIVEATFQHKEHEFH